MSGRCATQNKIGDKGMRQLGDAFKRGAAPAIKEVGDDGLVLHGNPASDAAKLAAKPRYRYLDGAFLVAHFADAKELSCIDLGWGDEEARRFAAALEHAAAHGALKALEWLTLGWGNKIGDEGMRHLADALARGAAPALETLVLWENKIGDEGVRHLGDALARGAAPALTLLNLFGNLIGDEGLRHLGDALARGAAPRWRSPSSCLLYTSPSPRDKRQSRMPSSA